jgi:hypothetical protein
MNRNNKPKSSGTSAQGFSGSFSKSNKNSSGTSGASAQGFSGSFSKAAAQNRSGTSGASANNRSGELTFGESFSVRNPSGELSWFGFSYAYVYMINRLQKDIFNANGILFRIQTIFKEVFGDGDGVASYTGIENSRPNQIPAILLKMILYSQINPLVPLRLGSLNFYLRNFFEYFRNYLLEPIFSLPDNVTSRIIVTITLGLLHEYTYRLTMHMFPEPPRTGRPPEFRYHFQDSKIASLFTEAFYVFGLNEHYNTYNSFPINLPDAGDVVSFLWDARNHTIEARSTEVKISRNGLVDDFLDRRKDTRLKAKRSELNNPRQIIRTPLVPAEEPYYLLPPDRNMIFTKVAGTYLAKSFYRNDQMILEFQNESRSTERRQSVTQSFGQYRLVITTRSLYIQAIYDEVIRLFSIFSDRAISQLNYDSMISTHLHKPYPANPIIREDIDYIRDDTERRSRAIIISTEIL